MNDSKRQLAMQWVVNSKQLVLNPWNHAGAIQDNTFMESLAFFMADQDDDIIMLALEIGHLLLQNPKNFSILQKNDIFILAYKLAYVTYKDSKQHRYFLVIITDVLEKLKSCNREIRERNGLQLNDQLDREIWGDTTVYFQLPGLKRMNCDSVCLVIAQVPGVISCHPHLDRRLVKVTVRSGFSPGLLKMTVMARLLLDVYTVRPSGLRDLDCKSDEKLPPYFPEIDSPVKQSALSRVVVENIKQKANGLVGWFQESFYW